MTEASTLVIVVALLGIAGSVSGVWLGRYLERDNEAKKWRRDHALEAYTDFLHTAELVVSESVKAWHMECETKEKSEQSAIVLGILSSMYRAFNRIVLLSSEVLHKRNCRRRS